MNAIAPSLCCQPVLIRQPSLNEWTFSEQVARPSWREGENLPKRSRRSELTSVGFCFFVCLNYIFIGLITNIQKVSFRKPTIFAFNLFFRFLEYLANLVEIIYFAKRLRVDA